MRRQNLPRQTIRKAADKPMPVAAYDRNGKLVGVIMDPSKIQPLAEASPDDEPAPKAETGTPADDSPDGVTKFRKALHGPDAVEQVRAANRLNAAAIVEYQDIRRKPPRVA